MDRASQVPNVVTWPSIAPSIRCIRVTRKTETTNMPAAEEPRIGGADCLDLCGWAAHLPAISGGGQVEFSTKVYGHMAKTRVA